MKKEEVRSLIYSLLNPLVLDKSFRFKKAGEGILIRSVPGGNQRIGVPLVDHSPKFKFSLFVTIRIDAVEEIIHSFLASPTKYRSQSSTFTSQLDRFIPGKEAQFTVLTESDIKAAVAQLEPIFEKRIIPFLDQTQDTTSLAKAMNLTEIPKFLSGTSGGMRALTVARLIGSPDFETIAAQYQQRFSQLPQQFRDEFQDFIQHLRQSH